MYSFGHGLSYSNFVYEKLELSDEVMKADGEIKVSIIVRNESDVAGKETVMLYMRDLVASTARPIQSLIGFHKVEFKPYERKTIEFSITAENLKFWNADNKFVFEPGEFEISTGYADHLKLTKCFKLI